MLTQSKLKQISNILSNGGVIGIPTDTVYGIGCDIFNKEALERVFAIKQDSGTKLFSFVCSDLKDIAKYAKVSDWVKVSVRAGKPEMRGEVFDAVV
ncbi:MAG: Sua5/YciO/YrdC/YwlC family protein, partial [Candidatus Riflemargulisbacteria bacterium]